MNKKLFTPRGQTLLASFVFIALLASACSGPSAPAPTPSANDLRATANAMDPAAPAATSVAPTAAPCLDGEVIGNDLNNLDRTPVGLGENNSALEASWRGQGFGNFDRTNLVIPALGSKYQVFLVNVETIHTTRYCGILMEVESYLSGGAHVKSMQVTAADTAGNMPTANEIGVYSLDLTNKTLKVLKAAPAGPTLEEVMTHIQIVDLQTGQIYGGPTIDSSTGGNQPVAAVICPPAMVVDLGPWESAERTIAGPAIVNIGFPAEGDAQVRTFVPAGTTAVFHNAAGSGWQYDASCDPGEIQRQLTANAGGITVISLDDLVAQGKAKK